jgi:glyoxylase-like metal-dependent hydrolase (beta-lactamase superfamily II)
MSRYTPAVVVAALLLVPSAPADAQTPAPTPRDRVARALTAMGGEQAVRGLTAVSLEFYGTNYALGQEETPESPARASAVAGRTTTDYTKMRRVSSVELRNPAGAVNRLRRVTEGGIGLLETNGRFAPDGPGAVAGVETSMRREPERLLLAALDEGATLSALPPKRWRGEPHDGVRYQGRDTLDLYFDRRTGLLTVVEATTEDGILGDRRTATWYTRWQDAGGVSFARQYDQYVNDRLATQSITTAVAINTAVADSLFAIPDSIAQRAQRATPVPPPPVVTLVELAPYVWRVEGGTHHSLIVEQPTGLVVIEAPQNARRSQAVLDTLRARFPGKAVAMVVNTHHHWDHAGGLRAYLAAGIPVVTQSRNAAFVRGIGTTPKTVTPDALSRKQRQPPAVRTVDDSLAIGAGDSRVVLYRLPTTHVQGMLAAYVPGAKVLFNSDVLTPGATLAPAGSREIVAFVQARGITVDRVAGGHGGVASWADVEKAAQAQ